MDEILTLAEASSLLKAVPGSVAQTVPEFASQ